MTAPDRNRSSDWPDTSPGLPEAPGHQATAPAQAHPEPPARAQPRGAPPDLWAQLPQAPAPARLPLRCWMREGLRSALFLCPRTAGAVPTGGQALLLALAGGLLLAALAGLLRFYLHDDWVQPMALAVLLQCLLARWAMAPQPQPDMAPAPGGALLVWYLLSAWGALAPVLLFCALVGSDARWPALWDGLQGWYAYWVLWYALLAWPLVLALVLAARLIRGQMRAVLFAMALTAVYAATVVQLPEQPWMSAARAASRTTDGKPRLQLSQATFEGQQALWQRQVDALAPQQPGVTDVYALVFAPYAGENVFRNESSMVATLLQQRFDARGRVLHLLNHAETAASHPWATPQNLQRAIAALAARMDREQDLLLVYLTSHGARDHKLEAANWPLEVAPVTPEMLRAALDGAAIRNRVIVVSACYAGGWIAPLASADSLVMTAADATHTSYGCGALSDLTFFGRAVFDEQLRQTHSFTQAFSRAVPLIAQREKEAGKEDGFSNPQIHVGAQIAPLLRALEQRLDAADSAHASATGEKP